jgi:hypothetical protein
VGLRTRLVGTVQTRQRDVMIEGESGIYDKAKLNEASE